MEFFPKKVQVYKLRSVLIFFLFENHECEICLFRCVKFVFWCCSQSLILTGKLCACNSASIKKHSCYLFIYTIDIFLCFCFRQKNCGDTKMWMIPSTLPKDSILILNISQLWWHIHSLNTHMRVDKYDCKEK